MVYAMADKFLDKVDLKELQEEIKMTRLGQMLIEDGYQQGMSQGISQGINQGIQALVETCGEFGAQKEETVERVIKKFSVSRDTAEAEVEKYWK